MTDVEAFRAHIIDSGYVLDPEGTHSEFVSGMHGQKLDFDNIDTKTDPLFHEWIDVNEDFIRQQFNPLPEILVGVANGTNRVSVFTAHRFKGDMLGLESKKNPDNSKELYLPSLTLKVIQALRPARLVVVEDVGTTGSNSVQIAVQAKEAGAKEVEVVTTWKRRDRLERLEEAGIPYRPIIDETLPTYTPEECATDPMGFHARGWEFKRRTK